MKSKILFIVLMFWFSAFVSAENVSSSIVCFEDVNDTNDFIEFKKSLTRLENIEIEMSTTYNQIISYAEIRDGSRVRLEQFIALNEKFKRGDPALKTEALKETEVREGTITTLRKQIESFDKSFQVSLLKFRALEKEKKMLSCDH